MNNTLKTITNIKKLQEYRINKINWKNIVTDKFFNNFKNTSSLESILEILHYPSPSPDIIDCNLFEKIRLGFLKIFINNFFKLKGVKLLKSHNNNNFYINIYHSILIHIFKKLELNPKMLSSSSSSHLWTEIFKEYIDDNNDNIFKDQNFKYINIEEGKPIDIRYDYNKNNYMLTFNDINTITMPLATPLWVKKNIIENYDFERSIIEYNSVLNLNLNQMSNEVIIILKYLCFHFHTLSSLFFIVSRFDISDFVIIQNNNNNNQELISSRMICSNIEKLQAYRFKNISWENILSEKEFKKFINDSPLENMLEILHYQYPETVNECLFEIIQLDLIDIFVKEFLKMKNITISSNIGKYHKNFYTNLYYSILIYIFNNMNINKKLSLSSSSSLLHLWDKILLQKEYCDDGDGTQICETQTLKYTSIKEGKSNFTVYIQDNENQDYMFIFNNTTETPINIKKVKQHVRDNFNFENHILKYKSIIKKYDKLNLVDNINHKNIFKYLCLHFNILSYIISDIHILDIIHIQQPTDE